eukprot:TRINITY_DN4473_c0_g6_i1.p1 TRINITY_DN4473_c0_g6~~TRINITY_DN4473_c0_g6_i1.p1  ORF type:complete len:146 (+),score=3.56 TRINITY_DN4473_c0_g6_i1:100-537(+)
MHRETSQDTRNRPKSQATTPNPPVSSFSFQVSPIHQKEIQKAVQNSVWNETLCSTMNHLQQSLQLNEKSPHPQDEVVCDGSSAFPLQVPQPATRSKTPSPTHIYRSWDDISMPMDEVEEVESGLNYLVENFSVQEPVNKFMPYIT